MASTYPNRHYQWGAQNGGQKSNEFPTAEPGSPGRRSSTGRLRTASPSAITRPTFPSACSTAPGRSPGSGRSPTFYTDAALGNLPNICFVDPPFLDGGGGNGLSADEHPHGDIRLGQAFMSDIVHAFIESPQYERGALFINYDEWGGFFDHVPPPFVPDDRRNRRNIDEDWGLTGFRIPGVCVSPFTRGGRVSHMPVTHESILKLISYRFRLGHLNKRHRYATNIGRTFNWRNPDPNPPSAARPGRDRGDPVRGPVERAGAARKAARHHRAPDLGVPRPARIRGSGRHASSRSSDTRTPSARRSRRGTQPVWAESGRC